MPLRVILSGEKNARIFLKVETRRANGNAVWISQKIELSLINNGIPNQLTARSDREAVALRVSTKINARRFSLSLQDDSRGAVPCGIGYSGRPMVAPTNCIHNLSAKLEFEPHY